MSTPLPVPDGPRRAGSPPPPFETDQDPADVLQETEDYDVKAVPVCIDEPVRTQELPARSGACYQAQVDTTGLRILGRDPRRKSATIIAISQDLRLGTTQANALNGARIPAVVPFVISHIDEVWAATLTGTTEVSVITEQWAD